MVSSFTVNKRLEQPAHNDYVDSWDIPENANKAILDLALGSGVNINLTGLSGNQALTTPMYQPLKIIAAGGPIAATNLVVPAGVGGLWVVRNNTTGGFAITISSAAGGALVAIPAGTNTLVNCDGSATGMFYAINTPPAAGGINTQVQFNSSGLLAGSTGLTWDGTKVSTTGLVNSGNTTLGDSAGDTLAITGTAISTPNGAVFNVNQLVMAAPPSLQVGIGTATLGTNMLTVAGAIASTAGGFVFPDGTSQTTAFAATGVVLDFIGGTLPVGWVWANGNTIGNATSNATGRANADAFALFSLLWAWAAAQAAIFTSTGAASTRTGSALADFNLNKAIAVPDLRGMVIAGMDVIGGSASADRLSSYIASTTPGATGGNQFASYGFHLPNIGVNVGNFGGGGFGASGYTTGGLSAHIWGNTTDTGGSLGTVGGGPATGNHSHYLDLYGDAYGTLSVTINSLGASGATVPYDGGTNNGPNIPPTMVLSKIIKL